ncbi:MAG: Rossman fold protein, TIGR00730 family [Pirellulaceae bacterium]|nr:MAG: Rossman fold protein, TIGR00730 family [Pirellulaceae bacterium]
MANEEELKRSHAADEEDLRKHPEAEGEDEKERPQPADEPADAPGAGVQRADLIEMMERTIRQLESDGTTLGDLKILSRTLRELRYAFKVFQPYRRRRKVTIFGSARTPPDHPNYQQAMEFARCMASHGWMIITGAGGGIMEAGHVGAGRELSMGLNIMLPFEQAPNPVIDGDPKLVTMKYFFTRKLMFVKECSAVCSLPGGYGTLDETAEVLTLLQTGKQTMIPVVLLDAPGGDYWSHFHEFIEDTLLRDGMISPEDLSLYKVTDSVHEAVDETLRFYRVYHSMRYVGDTLVLRMRCPLTAEEIEELNDQFSDILVSGKIEQGEALPPEANEPEIAHLPRLKLHFDRKQLGRLRQLIDALNQMSPECEGATART